MAATWESGLISIIFIIFQRDIQLSRCFGTLNPHRNPASCEDGGPSPSEPD